MSLLNPTRVMIVDDDLDIRVLLKLLLEQERAATVVAQAEDGPQAITMIEGMSEETFPQVVIVDYRLPTMSGLDVAQELLRSRPDLPIILFSAYLDDAAREMASSIGVRACVSKNVYLRLPELVASLGSKPLPN